MADQYFREFQTLWFTASISGGNLRLSVGGQDPSDEELNTAASPGCPVPNNDVVHDRIKRTQTVTYVRVVVEDPAAGPQLVVSSYNNETWTRSGSHQYTDVEIPVTEGNYVDLEMQIVATVGMTTYQRAQTVRIKHRATV